MSAFVDLPTLAKTGNAQWSAVEAAYRADEAACVAALLRASPFDPAATERVATKARELVAGARARKDQAGRMDAFLREFGLSSREGVALMCLAEALLRIPDVDTADRLIREKLADGDWERHLGKSESLLVNASTYGLMLTGKLAHWGNGDEGDLFGLFRRLAARSGEPIVREAVGAAMRILGRQFVMGRTMDEAMERARAQMARGYRHSFDMLGEEAKTQRAADRYFEAYRNAIAALRGLAGGDLASAPSISVKLSALHPRYEWAQGDVCVPALAARLRALASLARETGVALTVDAEEADRLLPSLAVFEQVAADPQLKGWDGLGLAVQAYQKRAPAVIDWLADLARRAGRRIPVRLVKGAYWDSEIKRAQERALAGYPVFTRKASTDLSYLVCAARLFASPRAFYPQLASHNAQTVAAVLELAGELGKGPKRPFEFQRLHGMGRPLYGQLVGPDAQGYPCRVYAPVGSHEDLLPYLVRRLLENGANSSFVHRLSDEDLPIERLTADPVATVRATSPVAHPGIPLPRDLYAPTRLASFGVDLSDPAALRRLADEMARALDKPWQAASLIDGKAQDGPTHAVRDPADRRRIVGAVAPATFDDMQRALAAAVAGQRAWAMRSVAERAAILEAAGDLVERDRAALMALCVREAGKTLADAASEVREAADYCRYYAAEARRSLATRPLPGPTGEENRLEMHGRGVFACISPWNFPLAIFTGQVVAALVAGNAVIAKPAEQTPLVAAAAVRLLHEAGIPAGALHLLPGSGRTIGAALVADACIAGVAFTGSTEVAKGIAQALAARDGALAPLIAETGGQNAMIVDSSALPEQVTADVLVSAFQSAGQRCSSLRVLFLQEDIADRLIAMLAGAAAELVVGDPARLATDVGPMIDEQARDAMEAHGRRMAAAGRLLFQAPLSPSAVQQGAFFAPRAYEIPSLDLLTREVFGPILHVIRWRAGELERVADAVAATGYGLTLGIHSRIAETAEIVRARLGVGNSYVNRNMIGAVVGVQPFGGEGLSGTGPKAGGPHYLPRFALERTVTVNSAAAGGNAGLLSLDDEGGKTP
ncbi:MAG TPA: bifunctional proline dehydrogenase/L-glutamate gamma-semialdehyde dehydrogenase PutA [Alphaproteobacteria bacterium]|jgi:RHH-type proline utilization regulon transcriptional repressor/proline dehydrogenase/delta 1-pyrroline-5-carboxylate dehydrogenase